MNTFRNVKSPWLLFAWSIVATALSSATCAWEASQFELTLNPEKTPAVLGQTAYVLITIKNKTAVAFVHENPSFSISAKDANGKEVPTVWHPMSWNCLGAQDIQKIGPHATANVRLLLNHYLKFPAPGTYELRATMQSAVDAPNGMQPFLLDVVGYVQIEPGNDTKLKAMIDSLGEAMLKDAKDGGTPGVELAAIADPRSIPYWLQAFESKNSAKKFAAILALERIDDPRVFALFKKVLGATDQGSAQERNELGSLRDSVSCILSRSSFTAAHVLLSEQRKHPDARVRVNCLSLHRQMPLDKATAFLKEMAADTDEHIRAMAQLYLKELELRKEQR